MHMNRFPATLRSIPAIQLKTICALKSGRCATIIGVNWIPLIAVDQLLTLDMEVTRHLINESDCLIEAAYRQNSWHDSMRSCK